MMKKPLKPEYLEKALDNMYLRLMPLLRFQNSRCRIEDHEYIFDDGSTFFDESEYEALCRDALRTYKKIETIRRLAGLTGMYELQNPRQEESAIA